MIEINSFSSFFVANWKLNGDFKFIDQFIDNLKLPSDNSKCVVICPTSIHLDYMKQKKNNFYVGAQNVSEHAEGAYTGEISCNALSELNIDFCIIGHSERRHKFNETNNNVSLKSSRVIEYKIIPIICIGETLEEKESRKTNDILSKQLKDSIPINSNSDNTIIAYEPVWAIGTGLTPTLEEINKTHEFIKNYNSKFVNYKILYGGSVKSNNAKEIVSLSNVDGALIGGSSLKYDDFTKIIED
ncbi:triose-phosphate isomerase [Alphaproteobacteria bacterium]|nr:triose-phosphate isomerase [Alphaproteobacteria bacterium]